MSGCVTGTRETDRMNQWTANSDKKPMPGHGVLVWSPSNRCCYMACWDGKAWKPWDASPERCAQLTHWMPVPDRPDSAGPENSADHGET